MPHDAKGNLLKPGDQVAVLFTVKEVHQGEEYCNVSLATVIPMYPGEHATALTVNSKQTAKRPDNSAQAAYEGYRAHTGGKSLATGQDIPEWGNLSKAIQAAWGAAAAALI